MGYCSLANFKALVYQYMPNGSLYNWVHTVINVSPCLSQTELIFQSSTPLLWDLREAILKDTLRDVAYLHAGQPPMINQDVKRRNIYLFFCNCTLHTAIMFLMNILMLELVTLCLHWKCQSLFLDILLSQHLWLLTLMDIILQSY